jgi:hypothetical protein
VLHSRRHSLHIQHCETLNLTYYVVVPMKSFENTQLQQERLYPPENMCMISWYVPCFRIPASHGISGVHLFANIPLLLCWLVCGMEAAALLSQAQRSPLKLCVQHILYFLLILCIMSFIRLATLCILNKHRLICGYVPTICVTKIINVFIYKVEVIHWLSRI